MKLTAEQRLNKYMLEEKALSILYPRTCPVCGKILKIKQEDLASLYRPERAAEDLVACMQVSSCRNPYICPECDSKIDRCAATPRCLRCSKPLEDPALEYCRDCRTKDRHFDIGMAPILHNEAARDIMYDLKYRSMKCNADFAAFEMAASLLDHESMTDPTRRGSASPLLDVDAIIPVPLHRKRLSERGYNQAALIADRLEFFLELAGFKPIPIDENYLVRTQSSERLKELSGQERAAALSGIFSISGETGRYRKVLLVDDIFTTGATLNECAKTLRQAGVSVIYFMTATIGS